MKGSSVFRAVLVRLASSRVAKWSNNIGMSEKSDQIRNLCQIISSERGWEARPNGVRVSWQGGRHQLVAVDFFEDRDREFVRLISRIGGCDLLDEDRLMTALRVNAGLACGHLAIMQDVRVLVGMLSVEDVSREQLERSIGEIAQTADSYEKALFAADAY
jgi:hypothetical protein